MSDELDRMIWMDSSRHDIKTVCKPFLHFSHVRDTEWPFKMF